MTFIDKHAIKKFNGRTKPLRCTMCNRILNEFDINGDFSYHKWIGYGSIYDLNKLDLDLCSNCFDKVLTYILKNSAKNPLREYDFKNNDKGEVVAYLIDEEENRG